MFKCIKAYIEQRRADRKALDDIAIAVAEATAEERLKSIRLAYETRYCPLRGRSCVLGECVFWTEGIIRIRGFDNEPLAVAMGHCRVES